MTFFLGIDIGSVSEKVVAIDSNNIVVYQDYRYSYGKVLPTLTGMLKTFHKSEFGHIPVEQLDGLIFVPPALVDTIPLHLAKEIEKYRKRADYWKLIQFLLLNLELRHQEQKVRNIFEKDILNNFDMKPKEILEKTSKYLNKEFSICVHASIPTPEGAGY